MTAKTVTNTKVNQLSCLLKMMHTFMPTTPCQSCVTVCGCDHRSVITHQSSPISHREGVVLPRQRPGVGFGVVDGQPNRMCERRADVSLFHASPWASARIEIWSMERGVIVVWRGSMSVNVMMRSLANIQLTFVGAMSGADKWR